MTTTWWDTQEGMKQSGMHRSTPDGLE